MLHQQFSHEAVEAISILISIQPFLMLVLTRKTELNKDQTCGQTSPNLKCKEGIKTRKEKMYFDNNSQHLRLLHYKLQQF